ncbi:MAG: bifunctional (p)ppGpp synthetase/guanosine-3',5'-bis(diphosphate) 3'-pyrophosphohydrolase, partial [Proteobacteria bacterium]|nr:bifunctional (p)ppGpp synthetase/guanosine-3',5'-bis(diphosphate) 3'-pyrophosphohydrolase [Pseudomonadota bacterium]
SIHSKLGDHIVGARINGKLEPLRYKLRNGDVIEVVTSNTQQPTKGWLDFVITTRARSRIRNWLRQEERDKSIRLGRELLEREFQRTGISLTKLLKDDNEVRHLVEAMKVQTFDELLLALGYGKIDAHDVVDVVAPQSADGKALVPPSIKENVVARAVRKVIGRDEGAIVLNGIDDVLVRYAKCCNPIPGEDILGFITRGRGITVHRRGCGKAFDSDPERRVEITWDAKAKINRDVQIRVTATNKPGILGDVGQTFNDLKINVIEANCRATDDGRAISLFTFNCGDMARLRDVMRAIGKVKGVTAVERI